MTSRRVGGLLTANAAQAITPAPRVAPPAPSVAPAPPPSDVDKVAAQIADDAFRERNNLYGRGALGATAARTNPARAIAIAVFGIGVVLPSVAWDDNSAASGVQLGLGRDITYEITELGRVWYFLLLMSAP